MIIHKTKSGLITARHSKKDFLLKIFRNEDQFNKWKDTLDKNNFMLSFYKVPLMIERYEEWTIDEIEKVTFDRTI